MAQWQFKLNIHDVWKQDGYDFKKTATVICDRLLSLAADVRKRNATVYQNMADELEYDILPMFEEVRDESGSTVDDFDNAMESLYDWADTSLDGESWGGKKMCWVSTLA